MKGRIQFSYNSTHIAKTNFWEEVFNPSTLLPRNHWCPDGFQFIVFAPDADLDAVTIALIGMPIVLGYT